MKSIWGYSALLLVAFALMATAPAGLADDENGPYKGPAGEAPPPHRDPPDPQPPPERTPSPPPPPPSPPPPREPPEFFEGEGFIIIWADLDGDGEDEWIIAPDPLPDPLHFAEYDMDGDGDVDVLEMY